MLWDTPISADCLVHSAKPRQSTCSHPCPLSSSHSPSPSHMHLLTCCCASLRRNQDPVITTIERRLALWSHLPLSHQEDMQARTGGGAGHAGRAGVWHGGSHVHAGHRAQLGSGRAGRLCCLPGQLTDWWLTVALLVYLSLAGAAIWPYQQVSIVGLRYAVRCCWSAGQGLFAIRQHGHAPGTLGL